jgi:hypothetical protein
MSYLRNIIGSISYREAQAWSFALINIAVLAIYSLEIWANKGIMDGEGLPAFAGLIIVAVCTTIFTILLIVPTAIIFNRTANEKADERDRRIYTEGRSRAFWVLFILGCFALIAYVFHQIGDLLFHTVLMSILIAQLVYALSIATKYRQIGVSFLSEVQK